MKPPARTSNGDARYESWAAWFNALVRSGVWATLNKAELRLVGAIIVHANEGLTCFPGSAQLMRLSDLDMRELRRTVRELQARRLISRRGGGGRKSATTELLTSGIPYQWSRLPLVANTTAPVEPATTAPVGLTPTAPVGTATTQNHPIEPSIKPSTEPGAARMRRRWSDSDLINIYKAYPRKVARPAALKAIAKALEEITRRGESSDPVEWLLAKVQEYAKSPAGNRGEFTPHPASFFNQGRFDDDPAEWQRSEHDGGVNGNKPPVDRDKALQDANMHEALKRAGVRC